jgi:hypothetical protein
MLQVPFDKAQINTVPVMATVSLLCLKPVNRGVPWCFSEKSNGVYTPPTEPRCIPSSEPDIASDIYDKR